MTKAPINIKELEFISDDGMSWLDDPTAGNIGKAVVFPSEKAFLDAVVENGQAKTEHTEYMKNYASDLKECIKVLGSMESVVKFIQGDVCDIPQEQLDELGDMSCIFFSYIDYCAVSGLHYEEVTKYYLDELFLNCKYSPIPKDRLADFILVDEDAKEQIWFMSVEYSLGYEFMLYKLSADEQEIMKQQIKEAEEKEPMGFRYSDNTLYVKGCIAVLEEILELFAE